MSVARCQQEVDSAEFTYWQQFASHEPIGQERWDFLFATVAHKIVAVQATRGRRPKVLDFLPKWWRKEKSAEEIANTFQQFFQEMKNLGKKKQQHGDD